MAGLYGAPTMYGAWFSKLIALTSINHRGRALWFGSGSSKEDLEENSRGGCLFRRGLESKLKLGIEGVRHTYHSLR